MTMGTLFDTGTGHGNVGFLCGWWHECWVRAY